MATTGPPREFPLARVLRELEDSGRHVGRKDGSWWWWESEFGTFHDPVPMGAFGPYPSIVEAANAARPERKGNR